MGRRNTLVNKCLKVASEVIEYRTKKENLQWPPICLGLIYQPKRPVNKGKETENEYIRN